HVKSNAIVYAKDGVTAGIGAGQMNRLESARIAAWKAKDAAEKAGWPVPNTIGSAVASDAFFPFADGLLAAAEAGATAVNQASGLVALVTPCAPNCRTCARVLPPWNGALNATC